MPGALGTVDPNLLLSTMSQAIQAQPGPASDPVNTDPDTQASTPMMGTVGDQRQTAPLPLTQPPTLAKGEQRDAEDLTKLQEPKWGSPADQEIHEFKNDLVRNDYLVKHGLLSDAEASLHNTYSAQRIAELQAADAKENVAEHAGLLGHLTGAHGRAVVAEQGALGQVEKLGTVAAQETAAGAKEVAKPGEMKPYVVKGPDGKDQIVYKGANEQPPAGAVPYEKPGGIVPGSADDVVQSLVGKPDPANNNQPYTLDSAFAHVKKESEKPGNEKNPMSVSVDGKPALVYPQPGGVYSEDPEGKLPIKGKIQPAKADIPAEITPAERFKTAHNYGYSTDNNGNTIYTTEAKAAETGQVFEAVSPAEVKKDRQAITLMGNVQLNASNYKKSVDALPGPVSKSSTDAMTKILSDQKLAESFVMKSITLGELSDMMSQGERAAAWNKLSKPEQNALTQYLRAKGAVIAYQRALTNQGRTNPEALMVEFETIPVPFVGATVADPRFESFQQNIDQVSGQFPNNLPGIKSPAQVRKQAEGQSQEKTAPKTPEEAHTAGWIWKDGPKGKGYYPPEGK